MSGKRKQTPKVFSESWKYLLVVLVLFMYGKSLRYGFVLDDDLFVRNHPLVQKGIEGIPASFGQGSMLHFQGSNFQIYRPFTVSFFAIQQSLFGFNPAGYHLFSILMYSVLCLVIYGLVRILSKEIHPVVALLVTGLFAVHPVHSEVVANIKSQDELLAALGCVGSLYLALRYIDSMDFRFMVYSILTFLVALFSKESAVAFLIAFPLTFYLFRTMSIKDIFKKTSPYVFCGLGFIVIRHFVLIGVRQDFETTIVENVLYGAGDASRLWATKASILLYYLRLLVWPVALSWDYSFNQIPLADWSDVWPILSVVLFVSLAVTGLMNVKRNPVSAWGVGLFLFLILPTSNIFFLNGTTFAERFLFLPSLGALTALVPLLSKLCLVRRDVKEISVKSTGVMIVVVSLVLVAFATSSRVSDWKDNLTLFESGAVNAPNSSRVQAGLATEYMNKAEKSAAIQDRSRYIELSKAHFKKALEIYPQNSNAAYKLGLIHSITGDTAEAIACYHASIKSKPEQIFALVNLSTIHAARTEWDSAATYLEKAIKYDSLNQMALTNLVVVNFNRGNDQDVKKYATILQRNGLSGPKTDELVKASEARSVKR